MTNKKLYVHQLVTEINPMLVALTEKVPMLYKAYFDNGFNSGGANAITDQDLSDQYALTAADIGAAITLLENLDKLLGADTGAVFNSDYAATINKIRFGKIG